MSSHPLLEQIADKGKSLSGWINERRRHLHQNPELSFQERETSAFVRNELEALGYTPSAPVAPGKHGFYTELKSPRNPDQYVLLRADMDALPIHEENDVPFRSRRDGVGHLCGHDAHTSMLLGAASILGPLSAELPYSVRLVFQHAEEMAPGGALDFVQAGLCNDVVACFGLHVSPKIEVGNFGVCNGEMLAMVGSLAATIRGRGGHGAAPHETIDPVPVAAEAIIALQQIVSRRIPPLEPAVVSVTTVNAGKAFNVIPSEVTLGGTLRTFNESRAPEIERLVHRIITRIAEAHDCEAEVKTGFSYPPVVNDPRAVDASREAIMALFGEGRFVEIEKGMGAEDFAYYAREKPSSFVYIGVRKPGDEYYPLHHPRMLPDETVFWRGAALLASMPFVVGKHLVG